MPAASIAARRALFLFSLALLMGLLAYVSPVTNANADPHLSLIVSQSLLEEHTLKLDAYRRSQPQLFEQYTWQTINIDGHTYYNYPLAPSIVALPAVAAARLFALDMLVDDHNHLLQNALSALICAIVLLLVFLLVRAYLPFRPSLLIALISTLGSTLTSTLVTAYWNLGVAVVFILLALLLVARFDAGATTGAHPYLLGFLIFAAYFTRPSAAIFIVIVFVYLFFKDRAALWRTAAAALVLFLAFVAFSRLQYGLWLPVYYTASQWFNPQGFLRPLYGVTFSPSRGLFTFSPFFLLILLGGMFAARRLQHALLFWVCALWLALQLFTVALTPQWHGGFSFGPRLLTDAVPALILMTAILWRSLAPTLRPTLRRLAISVYLLLGLVGIFINAVQGPFNAKAALWNAFPNIDAYPELLYDWRFSQPLTTLESFHERRLNFYEAQIDAHELQLPPYQWHDPLSPNLQVERDLWFGWWPSAGGGWWSETALTGVILPLPAVDPQRQYVLEIAASAHQARRAIVSVNGQQVGEAIFGPTTQRASFVFDGSLLAVHNTARVIMIVPDLYETSLLAAYAQTFSYDPHELGIKNAVVQLAPLPEN